MVSKNYKLMPMYVWPSPLPAAAHPFRKHARAIAGVPVVATTRSQLLLLLGLGDYRFRRVLPCVLFG